VRNRLPYSQLVIELDKLFFSRIDSDQQAEERVDTIEAFLEACGWTWDEVLEEMANEAGKLQTKPSN
jgi:hypothetical protein